MGRGRAKAKQTKVARELKYSTGGTDLEALRKELASAPPSSSKPTGWVDDDTDAEFDASADSDDEDDEDDDLDGKYGASSSR
jgi:Protein of unknown function (DUF3073)